MSNILFNGNNINFKIEGKGNAVVLLHGLYETLAIWDDFSVELSKEYRVISIDLPGHGKSECVASAHTMDLIADVVMAVLDSLQIKKCVMIGHSLGGYVTLAFAEKYPDMLKGFGLFHSHPLEDTEEAKINRTRIIEIVKEGKTEFISQFFPELLAPENVNLFNEQIKKLQTEALQMSKEGIIAILEGMKVRKNTTDVLRNNKTPFLAILGKQDYRMPYEKMLPYFSLPDKSTICVINHVGHLGFIEARDETLFTLKCFVMKCFF